VSVKIHSSCQHLTVFPHLHIGETIVGEHKMKFKKKELFLGVLLGTGLNLLNSLRERLPNNLDDIKTKVRGTYGTASTRLRRASDALRGDEDSRVLGNVGALLLGVGVGVGVGLLIAPARGEETRADLADKVSEFGDKVRQRTGKRPQNATGTYGENEQAV
jgi:YtxH-like protein